MARYSLATGAVIATNNAAAIDFKCTAAATAKLMEIAINYGVSFGPNMGLGRPANDGSVVQTGTTAYQPDDPADPASLTTSATTWTTAPTVPTTYIRRFAVAGAAGYGMIHHFPRGITFRPGGGLVLWNAGTAGNASTNVWSSIDE